MSDNYDFGGHIENDRDVNPCQYTPEQEEKLSPYGYLVAHLGYERGKKMFEGLQRLAGIPAAAHSGVPAIAFDVEGGRFVSIKQPEERGEEEPYSDDDD